MSVVREYYDCQVDDDDLSKHGDEIVCSHCGEIHYFEWERSDTPPPIEGQSLPGNGLIRRDPEWEELWSDRDEPTPGVLAFEEKLRKAHGK